MPYQVVLKDPNNPHTKGMVFQVEIVGGGIQTAELPTPSAENEGQILQYTGATTSSLTHGYFYECKAQGTTPETYAWENISVQP